MKHVEIYVKGYYNYKLKFGTWTYYLSYKSAVVKRSGNVESKEDNNNTKDRENRIVFTPNRITLIGIYEALNHITEPCEIVINVQRELGFNNPKKSRDKDIICRILQLIQKAGHEYNINITKDFYIPDTWDMKYGKKEKEVKSVKPDINNSDNVNDIFKSAGSGVGNLNDYNTYNDIHSGSEDINTNWRDMYRDITDDITDGKWVPGSGGY